MPVMMENEALYHISRRSLYNLHVLVLWHRSFSFCCIDVSHGPVLRSLQQWWNRGDNDDWLMEKFDPGAALSGSFTGTFESIGSFTGIR